MKNFKALVFIFTLFFVACTSNNNIVNDVLKKIDSLKQIYAPDTRIALWNVSLENKENKHILLAEIDNPMAKFDLEKTIQTHFPNLLLKINLLPKPDSTHTMYALVNNSVSSIRSKGKHSAEIANQALLGTPVKVLKTVNGWNLIQTPNQYIAWINSADIVKLDSTQLNEYKAAKKIVYNKQYGFSYASPNIMSQVITDLVIGDILPIIEIKAEFYKVKYPDNRIAFVKRNEVLDMEEVFNRKPIEQELVKTAKRFNGIPYLWGGSSSKAIDCSGFVSLIYLMNGIVLQRDASQQIKYGKMISEKYEYKDLKAGDLLFFGRPANDSLPEKVTHVVMYIGDTEFIHSSGRVRINSMDSTRSNFIPNYVARYIRTMRVIGQENGKTIQKISNNKFYQTIIPENHASK